MGMCLYVCVCEWVRDRERGAVCVWEEERGEWGRQGQRERRQSEWESQITAPACCMLPQGCGTIWIFIELWYRLSRLRLLKDNYQFLPCGLKCTSMVSNTKTHTHTLTHTHAHTLIQRKSKLLFQCCVQLQYQYTVSGMYTFNCTNVKPQVALINIGGCILERPLSGFGFDKCVLIQEK